VECRGRRRPVGESRGETSPFGKQEGRMKVGH